MIKQQMGYSVVCDYPGCGTCTQDIGEYAFWGDRDYAEEEWQESDGYSGEKGHYCHSHTEWDEEKDEHVPIIFSIANEFKILDRKLENSAEALARMALVRMRKYNFVGGI